MLYKDALASFTREMSAAVMGYGQPTNPMLPGYGGTSFMDRFYKESWIAKAVIERIPEDCFKKAYNWIASPEQVNALEAVERRFKIKDKKKRALMLARLDGEAYIYFDLGDNPSLPLNLNTVTRNRLRFVNVLRKTEIVAGPLTTDPMSPFYDQPEYYEVLSSTAMVRIHPSRIVRFVRNIDPATHLGVTDLLAISPTIIAAETARDNVVALTTEARIDVLKVKGLMDAVEDPEDEAAMVRRYALAREMKATNKMLVIDMDGEDYSQKSSSFSTLPEVIETMRREVAAAAEIPYSLLFGRAGGIGTNGETELSAYYDSIKTMQETDIQPACENLDEAVIRSALGNRPPEIYLEWQSLWQSSDKEKADIGVSIANAAKTLVDGGIVPADVLTASTVNALTENGSFPGLEQDYQEWLAGGGMDDLDNSTQDEPDGDEPQE